MATIHDVAKAAHVSVGTVSNYLNGKYIGPKRCADIQRAIEELHYSPNRIARSLKAGSAYLIYLILPNLDEGIYKEVYAGVYSGLKDTSYKLVLELTENFQEKEQNLLLECENNSCAGIILCTCMPDHSDFFQAVMEKIPLIFILRKPVLTEPYSFIGFDNYDIVYRMVHYLLDSGNATIGLWTGEEQFSCERACIQAFRQCYRSQNRECPENAITSLPISKELIFQRAAEIFSQKNYPQFMITSSKLIADSILEAAYYQNITFHNNIFILSLGDGPWYSVEQLYHVYYTDRSYQFLGLEAAKDLLTIIASPGCHEKKIRQLKDNFSQYQLEYLAHCPQKPLSVPLVTGNIKSIKIVIPEREASISALQYLFPDFTKRYHVEIETYAPPYNQQLPFLLQQGKEKSTEYDLYYVDAPWLPYLAANGGLQDISSYLASTNLANKLIPGILQEIAMYNGHIYGQPVLFCAQLLFYRKDWFNDPVLQNQFEEIYQRPLKPPADWFEYYLLSKFFTRKFNPDSPSEYGTLIGADHPDQLMTEVFPRIWSYDGQIFSENGDISIYSDEVIQACRNYLDCRECSNPIYKNLLLSDYPKIFAQGETALMIAADHHATYLIDRQKSRVYDKIGFAPLPKNISVQSGWSICLNKYSLHKEEAYNLLNWLGNSQIAIPYTLLGGGAIQKTIYNNPQILRIYPWLKTSQHSFAHSRKRYIPPKTGYQNPTEYEVESILAGVIQDAIKDPENFSSLLKAAEKKLLSLQKKL